MNKKHPGPASTVPATQAARPRPFYPSSPMSDWQWAVIEPLLPPPGNTGGRGGRAEKWDRRVILDAIFYVGRGGIAWRQPPSDFPCLATAMTSIPLPAPRCRVFCATPKGYPQARK